MIPEELSLLIKNRFGEQVQVKMTWSSGHLHSFIRSLLDAILAMPGCFVDKSFGGICYWRGNEKVTGYQVARLFTGNPSASHKKRFCAVKTLSAYEKASAKDVFLIDGLEFPMQDSIRFSFLDDGKLRSVSLQWNAAVSLFITIYNKTVSVRRSLRDTNEPILVEFNELEFEQYPLKDILPFARNLNYDFLFKFEDVVGEDGEMIDADAQHQEPSVVKSAIQWLGRMISFRACDRNYRYGALAGAGVSRGMVARTEGADSAAKMRAEGKISMNETISKDKD